MVNASTASWQPLGSSYYRQTPLYHLDHSPLSHLDLTSNLVASASHAGPTAFMRDPHTPVLVTDHTTFTRDKGNTVRVCSPAGHLLQTIVWDPPTPLLTLFYLPPVTSSPSSSLPPTDVLVLLTHSGLYRLYPLHSHPTLPAPYTQHTIPGAEEAGGVAEAKKAGAGAFVVRFGNGGMAEVRTGGGGGGGIGGEDDTLIEGFPSFAPAPSRGQGRKGRASHAQTGGEPKTVMFASTRLSAEETGTACWAVLPGEVSSTRGTEVLIGLRDGSGRVLRVDEIDCQEQRLPDPGPILALTPSPNGRFLAVLTSSPTSPSHPLPPYTLSVHTSSLSRSLSSCLLDAAATGNYSDEEGKERPRMVEWSGSNAVALGYGGREGGGGTVVVVGPFGETLKYFYSSPIHLTTEVDCVRVLCPSEGLDSIEMVPAPTLSLLLPGSLTPSALLLTASQLFHTQKSPKADEYIRSIGRGPDFVRAVEECVEAGGREWGVEGEGRELLKAAAFGKSFLEAYNPSSFVETTKTLRVLNAVRDYKVGIPLSWEQYHSLPPSHLIARLLSLNQHLLALRISAFLSLPLTPVIHHWARQLIASSSPSELGKQPTKGGRAQQNLLSDEEVCQQIVAKLRSLAVPSTAPSPFAATPSSSSTPSTSSTSTSLTTTPSAPEVLLSPADLALTAFTLGRPQLARLLVEREKRVGKQVPLLVRLGEGEEALRKAVGGRGGDLDLVFAVLLSLRRSLSPGDLFRLLERVDASLLSLPSLPSTSSTSGKPPPGVGRGPVSKLFELFVREHGGEEERRVLWDFWYQDDRWREMGIEGLREAGEEKDFGERVAKVRKAQKSFAEDKELGFEGKMVDDQIRLLVFQQTLEQENPGKHFVGLSVNNTIRALILAGGGLEKKAEKVRSDFKVPDKRYWYITLRALIQLRDFSSLTLFAKKKSPIGFEPFVEELIKAGAQRHAVGYVEKCEGRNRVELYVRCGEWGSAGQECVRRSERGKLIELKSRAPNTIVLAQLDEYLQEMNNAGI